MAVSDSFTIFGSNALRLVLLACLPAFERAHGVKAELEFTATNHTLQKMRAGATADVVIATTGALAALTAEGRLLAGSVTELAVAGVGACVKAGAPRPDIGTVATLKQALQSARSIVYSQAGQSGLHMAKLIAGLGLADTLRERILINPAGLVAERVLRGDAELGFQQLSELMAVPGVDIIGPLPDAVQLNSVIAAGIGAACTRVDAARALIRELAAAHDAMRAAGLLPYVPEAGTANT